MKLVEAWAKIWPLYREMALFRDQLPGYRDWRRPMVLSEELGREIGGLSVLLFQGEPLYHRFVAETRMVGAKQLTPLEPARGCFAGFSGTPEVEAVPLYREVGVRGLVRPSETRYRPACTWSDWVAALGYRLETGPGHAIAGKRITLPERDPVDHATEAMRVVAHLEWQRAGHAGYLGGELLFLMLAPHFRLDATSLQVSSPLRAEIERLDATAVTEISLLAAAMVAERIEALGPDHFCAYVDALDTPAPSQAPLFNIIGGSS